MQNHPTSWLSKSIFYVKNYPNLSQFFFIEEYQFRSTFFDIDIFLQHKYLNHLLNSLLDNYLTDIHSTMNYVYSTYIAMHCSYTNYFYNFGTLSIKLFIFLDDKIFM